MAKRKKLIQAVVAKVVEAEVCIGLPLRCPSTPLSVTGDSAAMEKCESSESVSTYASWLEPLIPGTSLDGLVMPVMRERTLRWEAGIQSSGQRFNGRRLTTQHLRRSCLMLQCLGQLASPLFELLLQIGCRGTATARNRRLFAALGLREGCRGSLQFRPVQDQRQ